MPHLIRHFLERKAKELNLPTKQFATDALDLLLARHWPGNVCELENVIERALVLSPDDLLTVADLRHTLAGPPPPAPRHATLG